MPIGLDTPLCAIIQYNCNGGSGIIPPTIISDAGGATALTVSGKISSKSPSFDGYNFLGWSLSSSATSASYSPGSTITRSTGTTTTLYAVWQKITKTVSFNANGGSGAPSTITHWVKDTVRLPTTKPTRAHRVFRGWATNSSATSSQYAPGSTYSFSNNIILYAVWSEPLTVPVLASPFILVNDANVITTTPSNNSFRHKLECIYKNQTIVIGTNIATSYTWTPPVSIANTMPNDNQCSCVIKCTTYDGNGKVLGEETVSGFLDLARLSTLTDFMPKIDNLSISNSAWTNEYVNQIGFKYVKGQGDITFRWRITPSSYGATVKKITCKFCGETVDCPTTENGQIVYGPATKAGNVPIEFKLVDSRGNINPGPSGRTVQVYDRIQPIAEFTVDPQRDAASPSTVTCKYRWNISSIDDSNVKTVKIAYKKKTASSWTTLTITPDTYSGEAEYTFPNALDAESYYNIKIWAEDFFGPGSTNTFFLNTFGDITLDANYTDGTVAVHDEAPGDGKDHWYKKEVVFEKRITAAGKKLVYIAGDEISVGIRAVAFPTGATADGNYQMDVPVGAQIDGSTKVKSGSISIYKYDGTAIWENKTAKDVTASSISTGQCVLTVSPMANGIVRCVFQFKDKSHPTGMNLHAACPVFGNLVLKVE